MFQMRRWTVEIIIFIKQSGRKVGRMPTPQVYSIPEGSPVLANTGRAKLRLWAEGRCELRYVRVVGPIDGHDGLASRDMFIRAMDSALNMVTDRTRYPIGYNKHQGTRICDYHDTGWGRSLPRTIRVDGWNSCDGGASAGYLQIDFSTNSSNSGMCSAIAGLATIGGAIPVLGPLTSIVSGLITVACN